MTDDPVAWVLLDFSKYFSVLALSTNEHLIRAEHTHLESKHPEREIYFKPLSKKQMETLSLVLRGVARDSERMHQHCLDLLEEISKQ